MTTQLTTEMVWQELEKQIFAVLGVVTAKNEARTVGIVYVIYEGRLYITSQRSAWKVRHIAQNPHVSLTVPIHKRIPVMPWIKIPAATITFSGTAVIQDPANLPADLLHKLYRGLELDEKVMAEACVLAVTPSGDFITYGVGVSLMTMRDPQKARGRTAVN